LHFNSLAGGVIFDVDAGTTIDNARELLVSKNMIQNAAGGFTAPNATTVSGESSSDVDNIKGTSGVLDTSGLPVDSQYLGAVGHTVITV
jgi:hypothetical protein